VANMPYESMLQANDGIRGGSGSRSASAMARSTSGCKQVIGKENDLLSCLLDGGIIGPP